MTTLHRSTSQRQRGAALLSAMLTVTLVATFAAAALWQQYRSIEVETAERARVQVAWLLVGALDWSRLILRVDGQTIKLNEPPTDNLNEPWATPLQEARLSTFLAADKNNTGGMTAEESLDAFLSGSMVDAQSKLNVNNLVDANKISAPDFAAFTKLFQLLDLPLAELTTLTENLKKATDVSAASSSISGLAPLMPQRVRQLTWLGLSQSTLNKLTPYITLLPQRTTVNINTASAVVIYAAVPKLKPDEAKLAVFARNGNPFKTLSGAALVVKGFGTELNVDQHSVVTNFFEVTGRLRLEQTVVEEQSLVQRDAQWNVRTIWRERVVVPSPEASANSSTASQQTSLQ